MKLHISSDLALPLDAVTQSIAFLARRGAGKTYGASKLAELMLEAGEQIVALDPVGVWYGLRISADGKGPGFDIPIFGGESADVPLEPGVGAMIADLIVDRRISAVLDVSMMRKGEQTRFCYEFAEQLVHRKKQKANRSPLHVFLEEAQKFVPERMPKGDPYLARMVGAFEDIGRLGRNWGLGVTMISQRPQSVNKEVLNQAEALFVLQTSGSHERKALADWIVEKLGKGQTSLVDELPELDTGVAYVWSPSWLRVLKKVHIAQKVTYDASATPKRGAKRIAPRPLSPDELTNLGEQIKATVERAKAEDPKELRRKIAALEKQLASRPAEKIIETKIERVEVLPAWLDERMRLLDTALVEAEGVAGRTRIVFNDTKRRLTDEVAIRVTALKPIPAAAWRVPARVVSAPAKRVVAHEASGSTPRLSESDHVPGEKRMMIALARRHPTPLDRRTLGALAGVKPTGGSFGTYLSRLRAREHIEEGPTGITLSDKGRAMFQSYIGSATTTEEIVAQWSHRLARGARRMLDELLAAYPKELSREELGERAQVDPSGGSFGTYLSRLKMTGLADVNGKSVRASEELFR